MKHYAFRIMYYAILAALLAACAAPTPAPTPLPFAQFILPTYDPNAATATPFQPAKETNTAISTYTASPQPSATFSPTNTPTATLTAPPATLTVATLPPASPAPTTPSSGATSSRTNYILFATFDFANKTIGADETIRYYNNTGTALSDLVLSVQPNIYTSAFTLNTIAQDGTALTSYTLSGQRLSVNLNQPLAPGSATTITLNFNLQIPKRGRAKSLATTSTRSISWIGILL